MIDIYTHIVPLKYYAALERMASKGRLSLQGIEPIVKRNPAIGDPEERLRRLEEFPDMSQVLTLLGPPLEVLAEKEDAPELASIANGEMAEIVEKYPEKFKAAIAVLPMNDIEAALSEIDRAVKGLGLRGIQLFTDIDDKPLDSPEFIPIYEKMAQYDLPIFIHPRRDASIPDYPGEKGSKYMLNALIGWPHATSMAMMRIACSGILEKYPGLKFITHHAGGTIPYLAKRIECSPYKNENLSRPVKDSLLLFYNDTAVQGNTANLMCAHAFFGAGHMMFGTDFPLIDPHLLKESIRSVERMDINAKEKQDIFQENAKGVLKL